MVTKITLRRSKLKKRKDICGCSQSKPMLRLNNQDHYKCASISELPSKFYTMHTLNINHKQKYDIELPIKCIN